MNDRGESPRLVLIGGPSGAGKTHFVRTLQAMLGENLSTAITMDDYYRDLAHLSLDERAEQNFDHPDALDWELLIVHVQALCAGGAIDKPNYDFSAHVRREETERVTASAVLLLDGIHALSHDAMLESAAATVYIDAPKEICLDRRLERDVSERGRDRQSVLRQFEESVWPMTERYILPARDRADVVIPFGASEEAGIEMLLRYLNG